MFLEPFTASEPLLWMVSVVPNCTSTVLATAPVVLITGLLVAGVIMTSSVAVGTWPVLQLVGVFQAVLVAPVQIFCAIVAKEKHRMLVQSKRGSRNLLIKSVSGFI